MGDVMQGPVKTRPPHAGQVDCDRGRHDWKYVGHSTRLDVYECRCCGKVDTD